MKYYNPSKNRCRSGFLPIEERYSLFEMANLHKDESGLPYNIWLDSVGIDRKTKHNSPRFKVDVDGDKIPEVSVLIDKDNPRVLNAKHKGFNHEADILNWTKQHYDVLISHWEHRITDKQALILLSSD